LALTAVVLEQDAAYWEVHVEQQQLESAQGTVQKEATTCNAMFGVSTKKDRQFYNALDEQADGEGRFELHFVCYFIILFHAYTNIC
jgi:hypothetical protein